MSTATFQGSITVGALRITANLSKTGVGDECHEPAMPAGVAGTLSTRTSDVAGVVTVGTGLGAGFTTGDIVAVFFDDSNGVPSVVYGKYATVAGDAISIADDIVAEYVGESPSGVVLPVEDTVVVICKKTVSNVSADKDDVTFIAVGCDQPAIGIFGGAAEICNFHIPVAASPPAPWDLSGGAANPLTSDPTTLVCYNGGVVAATFQYGLLLAT